MFEPSTVEVAVDAVGAAGGRTYSYTVPDRLAGLAAGEAVIVEFGRRQALGIVLGPVAAPDGMTTDLKPIVERVRSEGPLLPPLQLALARVIARHYLAPAAMVVRAALPPGTLERLEYVARVAASAADGATMAPGHRTTPDAELTAADARAAGAGRRCRPGWHRGRAPDRRAGSRGHHPAAARARLPRAPSISPGSCDRRASIAGTCASSA